MNNIYTALGVKNCNGVFTGSYFGSIGKSQFDAEIVLSGSKEITRKDTAFFEDEPAKSSIQWEFDFKITRFGLSHAKIFGFKVQTPHKDPKRTMEYCASFYSGGAFHISIGTRSRSSGLQLHDEIFYQEYVAAEWKLVAAKDYHVHFEDNGESVTIDIFDSKGDYMRDQQYRFFRMYDRSALNTFLEKSVASSRKSPRKYEFFVTVDVQRNRYVSIAGELVAERDRKGWDFDYSWIFVKMIESEACPPRGAGESTFDKLDTCGANAQAAKRHGFARREQLEETTVVK